MEMSESLFWHRYRRQFQGYRCFFLVFVLLIITDLALAIYEDCKFPSVEFNPEIEVQTFGKPTAFVSTKSIGVDPYTLIDPYRQSAMYHEYLLIGPGFAKPGKLFEEIEDDEDSHAEEIQLTVYDGDGVHSWRHEPNIIQHNLGKEYNWAMINSTGMLPSLTLINTTFQKTYPFSTQPNDVVSYYLKYPNLFRSRNTVPPMDVLIEFPANTRTMLTLKTLIDYQTFGLLRWRLSPTEPLLWKNKDWEFANPNIFGDLCLEFGSKGGEEDKNKVYLDEKELLCMYQKRFFRIENPCIKDMFLLYIIRGRKSSEDDPESYAAVNRLFIAIPMIYDVLPYAGWYELTDVYCSRPDDPEECGNPLDVTLTNEHLLILTDKGLYVSDRLSSSNANASLPYALKPLLKFTPIDPCAELDYFNCSQVGASILARQTISRQRLFYTPVCHIFQYPVYEDIVMLVIEHASQTKDLSHEQDLVTVLYAAKPYDNWKVLFYGKHEYITGDGSVPIKELLGIFFNHHRRIFDISILLNDDGHERTFRFVLPEPNSTYVHFPGYERLDGLQGNGFLEFEFPPIFHMTHFNVNPEPLDVYFLGDQMWIAEAGGAFVYLSIPVLKDQNGNDSYMDSCSFNHPDRTYVCTEKSHAELYVGRIGVTYSPIVVDFKTIPEFKFTMLYNVWPFRFIQSVALLGHFTAGYSGKIMLWYMFDAENLYLEQQDLEKLDDDCKDETNREVYAIKCQLCELVKERKEYGCNLVKSADDGRFRMTAFDPTNFHTRDTSTTGPLIPFLVDGDKVVVFEAEVPLFEGFKPDYNYLHDINVGNRIHCPNRPPSLSSNESDSNSEPLSCSEISTGILTPNCELYIRHTKQMTNQGKHTFLDGIRRSLYATVVKSFPMQPIPTGVIILILRDSNHAVIQLDISNFEPGKEFTFGYEHVGQTLYIPEHMSVLLTGFPEYVKCGGADTLHNMTRMVGYATRYYRQGKRIQMGPFKSFLINLGTVEFCNFYKKTLQVVEENEDCSKKDLISTQYDERRSLSNQLREEAKLAYTNLIDAVNTHWMENDNETGELLQPFNRSSPFNTYQEMEEDHLTFRAKDKNMLCNFANPNPKEWDCKNGPNPAKLAKYDNKYTTKFKDFECPNTVIWQIIDGGCHLRLYLVQNPVLKQNGGRISLDKYDSLSFTLKLRSLTPLGKSLIHRPLMSITNTNPDVVVVENQQTVGQDPQIMHITLTPTGLATGVATVTVRPLITSTVCQFADGSFSLLIQVQRMEGRRLHVNYPIPVCKPDPDDGQYERPWKINLLSCVTRKELLTQNVVRRPDTKNGEIFYAELPDNYRPPSTRGPEIPNSVNVYNVNPQSPNFKDWYLISKQSGDLLQCAGKKTKAECKCSDNDRLSDDIRYTDCKRMVYTVRRGYKTDISIEYDRLMKDSAQHKQFFSPKTNWSVYLEEVNDRKEFSLSSNRSKYLEVVNAHAHLHMGYEFYDARTLGITLHGTGLFHFRVTLGEFESFGAVSGYFMMFCIDRELNHVQLVVVMLLTISVCMVLVFCGFLVVRKRLSSQLPYQTMNRNKMKLE